jgi:hypothetical protein
MIVQRTWPCASRLSQHGNTVLWADTAHEEHRMWQHFVERVERYPDAPIYHYGRYESRAIATLAKRYATDAASISKRYGAHTASACDRMPGVSGGRLGGVELSAAKIFAGSQG